jgi:localization factor PodJL
MAESYKWFALAAAQGDKDSATKRDEIVSRLDQASLTAARLAAQTWTAEPQPAEAITVKTPPGGWEKTAAAVPMRKITAPAKPKLSAPMKITPQ